MKAQTYNRTTTAMVMASILSALAFDSWPGLRTPSLLLGIASAVGAIALYARNRMTAVEPRKFDLTLGPKVLHADLKRLEAALSRSRAVQHSVNLEVLDAALLNVYFTERRDLGARMAEDLREQEGVDYETLEKLLWRSPRPSEPRNTQFANSSATEKLCPA